MNAGGDGRQCLVSRNQIDISPDLIDFDFINFARYPKATNEEFASTAAMAAARRARRQWQKRGKGCGDGGAAARAAAMAKARRGRR
jgi:hypothetical protein